MKTVYLKLAEYQDHIGHCQLTYVSKNDLGQKLVYCLQDNHGIRLCRCTLECEPNYEVSFTKVKAIFERPVIGWYDSEYSIELKNKCNKWIDSYEGVKA